MATQADKAQAALDKEREAIIEKIIASFELEAWGKLPLTQKLSAQLSEMIAVEEKDIHTAVDTAEKPVSSGEQERYRGRRSGLESVRDMIELAGRATAEEVGKARQFEEMQSNELGTFYKAPAWGMDYLNEARKRAEKKSKAA